MTTSLAQQLQKLAVPQTSNLKRDKKRASLLFDPKEAASLSKEVFYQIGQDGFEELKLKNPQFQSFENNLFHITSRDFERSIQTAEANARLNLTIRKFMHLISPYFLLNCTHKALEWLIYRYYVHDYNKDDLVLLILPYHETNLFVRVLQIVRIKENDLWAFLKPLQKPGIHLAKNTLYNHAAGHPSFLQMISKNMLSAIEEIDNPNDLSIMFNFYCATFVGAIEYSHELNETQITNILPSLLKGLKSGIPDFCSSAYLITSRLLAKTTLSDKLLNKLCEKISIFEVVNLGYEGLLCLLLLYQTQEQYSDMPQGAFRNLAGKKWLPETLVKIAQEGYDLGVLLKPIFKAGLSLAVKNEGEEENELHRGFIERMLAVLKLDEEIISHIISNLLEQYALKKSPQNDRQAETWCKKIFETIERSNPAVFDKEISKIMNIANPNKPQQKAFRKIIDFENRDKYAMFDKLYHPSPEIRSTATKNLLKYASNLKEREQVFLRNVILDRLGDEDCGVVEETLNLCRGKVLNLLGGNGEFEQILSGVLFKCRKEGDFNLASKTLELLCEIGEGGLEIAFSIVPFLLPLSRLEVSAAETVINSKYARNHLRFLNLKAGSFQVIKNRTNDEDLKDVFENLKKHSFERSELLKLVGRIDKHDGLSKYLLIFLLCHTKGDNSGRIIGAVRKLMRESKIKLSGDKKSDSNLEIENLKNARENNLSLRGILNHIQILIKSSPRNNFTSTDFYSGKPEQSEYLISTTDFLLKGVFSQDLSVSKIHADALKVFFEHSCPDLNSKIEFLLNLSIGKHLLITPVLQLRAIRTVHAILNEKFNEKSKKTKNFACDAEKFFPYLLAGLFNPHVEIRRVILNTLQLFPKQNYLIESKDAILMDPQQIPVITSNYFSSNSKESLKKLIDIISQEKYPLYLKTGVVKSLKMLRDPEVLIGVSKFISRILSFGSFGVLESEALLSYIEMVDEDFAQRLNLSTPVWECFARVLNDDKSRVLSGDEFDSKFSEETNDFSGNHGVVNLDDSNEKMVVDDEDDVSLIGVKNSSEVNKSADVSLVEVKNMSSADERCPSVLLMSRIDYFVFEKFTREVATEILSNIIKTSTFSANPHVLPIANKVFKHIDLDVVTILQHLEKMRDVQSPKLIDASKRRRRMSVIPTVDILDTPEWKQGLTILEFIQNKKKARNIDKLLQVLFGVLKKCLDFDEQSSVEYPKQLILSAILHFSQKIEGNVSKSIFNMELIVQCIRASQNPQTHHHALILLATVAKIIPEQVLHHIMAIFTFMGSSVLRHDDAYSFQIINRIIETVIPILVGDNSKSGLNLNERRKCCVNVLRVFVDVINDVPEHRRLPLYKKLLQELGILENLHLFLLIIFEAHVVRPIPNEPTKRIDIASYLCKEFSPKEIISTSIALMDFLKRLPEDKDSLDLENFDFEDLIFNFKQITPKQFRHVKYTLLTFTSNLLSSKEVVVRVAQLPEDDSIEMETLFKNMIVTVLTYIQALTKIAEKNAKTSQAQYWKVMLHHSYDILDSLNALLSSQMFLLVIKGLTTHNLKTVKRRALELFNNKLQHDSSFFSDLEDSEMFQMVPNLLNIIKAVDAGTLESEEEVVVQTALLSLKLLVKLLAPKKNSTENFVQILHFITEIVKSPNLDTNILASAVLCLAELCVQLRAQAIPSLEKFMPVLIKILKSHKNENFGQPSLLLLSAITALLKILDCLALFLSPHLQKLLSEVCNLCANWNDYFEAQIAEQIGQSEDKNAAFKIVEAKTGQNPLIAKLDNVKQKIGNSIPLRVLIPAISNCFEDLIKKTKYKSIGPLMEILTESLTEVKAADLQSNFSDLQNFFLKALEFRTEHSILENCNRVEGFIIKALNSLVLKLSENTFRPLYYKLYDWAIRSGENDSRVVTFYVLSAEISENLKGLFVLFAGQFIQNAAQILDEINDTKNAESTNSQKILLLESVLKTLNNVFLHSTHKFINKERFDVLMQPLIDQLDNTISDHEARARDLLIPTIVNFAVAVGDDALWKLMNYQVLLKMRNASVSIRLLGLECLREVAKKLGEDFLPLLPETIPFLAELLEDEEEVVERACKKAVQELEKVLGEPLQKYF